MLSFFFFRLAFSLAVFFLSSALSSLSFARFATGAGKSQTNTSLPLPRFSQSPIEQASRGGGSAKSTSCVSFHSPKTDSIVFPSDPRVSDLERGLPLSALSLHVVTGVGTKSPKTKSPTQNHPLKITQDKITHPEITHPEITQKTKSPTQKSPKEQITHQGKSTKGELQTQWKGS